MVDCPGVFGNRILFEATLWAYNNGDVYCETDSKILMQISP